MKNRVFLSENFQFLEVKFSLYLNKHVFVMSVKIQSVQTLLRYHIIFVLLRTALQEQKVLFSVMKFYSVLWFE